MNKFYVFVVSTDLTVKRVWMNNSDIISALKEHKDITIFKDYLLAVMIGDELMWKDIKGQDSLSGTEK